MVNLLRYVDTRVAVFPGSTLLIRGHDYPPENPVSNGFDWEHDNSILEYDFECSEWKFEKVSNGHMLNCYPEYAVYSDELLLRTLNEF